MHKETVYPGETVIYCSDSQEPWSYCQIGIRGFNVESILKQCGFTRNRLTLPAPDSSQILNCIDDMFEHLTLNYYDNLFRESLLLKLLSVLCLHYTQFLEKEKLPQETHIKNEYKNEYVSQAIKYISETYMKGVTVSDIAKHTALSPTRLNRIFDETIMCIQYVHYVHYVH